MIRHTAIEFYPDGEGALQKFRSSISVVRRQNMQPIVRMLQLTDDADDCSEIVILHSDIYFSENEVKKIRENYAGYFDAAYASIPSETLRQKFTEMRNATDDINGILIRMSAVFEFPEKQWLMDDKRLRITFTKPCDYNNVDECYTVLERMVKERDTDANRLYFNITPAPANVSARMTLMAIDGLRKLYYYRPELNPDDNKKPTLTRGITENLIEVDKNEIPLHNLLSQALDSFEIDD